MCNIYFRINYKTFYNPICAPGFLIVFSIFSWFEPRHERVERRTLHPSEQGHQSWTRVDRTSTLPDCYPVPRVSSQAGLKASSALHRSRVIGTRISYFSRSKVPSLMLQSWNMLLPISSNFHSGNVVLKNIIETINCDIFCQLLKNRFKKKHVLLAASSAGALHLLKWYRWDIGEGTATWDPKTRKFTPHRKPPNECYTDLILARIWFSKPKGRRVEWSASEAFSHRVRNVCQTAQFPIAKEAEREREREQTKTWNCWTQLCHGSANDWRAHLTASEHLNTCHWPWAMTCEKKLSNRTARCGLPKTGCTMDPLPAPLRC